MSEPTLFTDDELHAVLERADVTWLTRLLVRTALDRGDRLTTLERQRDDREKVVAAARELKWGDMLHGYHCHGGDQQSPCTCGIRELRRALDTKPTDRGGEQ